MTKIFGKVASSNTFIDFTTKVLNWCAPLTEVAFLS